MHETLPILVVGASGWLGRYLVPEFLHQSANSHVVASFASRQPNFASHRVTELRLSSTQLNRLNELNVSSIVNVSRGESDADFYFHQSLIELSNRCGAKYVYASSSNAVDADVSKSHFENDPPISQSDYGRFKAKCETELIKTCVRPVVFRFAAAHGWAPNRMARTEEFLRKLAAGERVPAYRGVVQNRTFIGDLARMVTKLVLDESAEGVFNLGTSDFSEEVLFLRRMAVAFGYSEDQVSEGERLDWNAVMVVDKWLKQNPEAQLPTESDTIRQVRNQTELQKYVNRAVT